MSRPAPGDVLLHPAVPIAMAVLVVNDHVLKEAWPGWLTGKLSDVAGAFFFPLLIQAAVELSLKLAGRYREPARGVLLGALGVTGAIFVATELSPSAAAFAAEVAGAGDAFLAGRPVLTPDGTDLIALLALPLAYRVGAARLRSAEKRNRRREIPAPV